MLYKKGGSYTAVAPRLEPGKFNKWKKRMLYYLIGMEPYYIQCIKNGSFKPKTAQGDAKPENQWTEEKRRVDEEEVSDDEETRVQVLMALADDELLVGKNHARNDKSGLCVDNTDGLELLERCNSGSDKGDGKVGERMTT
ncbi:hypothetical protein Tco_0013258 [Tanacetum coccineum]